MSSVAIIPVQESHEAMHIMCVLSIPWLCGGDVGRWCWGSYIMYPFDFLFNKLGWIWTFSTLYAVYWKPCMLCNRTMWDFVSYVGYWYKTWLSPTFCRQMKFFSLVMGRTCDANWVFIEIQPHHIRCYVKRIGSLLFFIMFNNTPLSHKKFNSSVLYDIFCLF